MAFWGAIVKPGKAHPFVPPPEEWHLHLSQATLEPTVPEGQRVAVQVKTDPEEDAVMIATLTAGRTDTVLLDLFFSQYTEFTVLGEHPVHLSGYYSIPQLPDDDDEDGEDEDDDDEEYEPPALGFPMHGGDGDEDEEDDEDGDEDDEDEDDDLGEDDEDDEDEDGLMVAGGDDEEMFGYPVVAAARRKPHVVIEDVTEAGGPAEKIKKKSEQQQQAGAGKEKKVAGGKAKAPEDEEMADQEEDEDEEDDEEEESEEEESEEEEEEEAPAKGAKQAAVGGKRPAEGKPTANGGVAKADVPAAKKQAVGKEQPQPAAKGKEAAKAKQQQPQQPPVKQDAALAKPQPQQKQQQTPQQQPAVKQDAKPQQQKQPPQQQQPTPASKAGGPERKKGTIRRHPNGFEVEDVSYGNPQAKLAKPGSRVQVLYTGRLKTNGKVFDKSGNKPFQFRLGVGEVVKGWDLGVEGMRVGDKRRLVVPPQLAYGTAGVKGTIPPNATLEFDVELLAVK